MFYVANIITLSVFLEVLWRFTLLVRYNRSEERRVSSMIGSMSEYTQSYRKYLLIPLLSSLYVALYKPSELVGLVTMALTL